MAEADAASVADLVARAMGCAAGTQALDTFRHHFQCRRHGIDDGRIYYVLTVDDTVLGVTGLHRYVWGPKENIWLAWFAIEPSVRRQGFGAYLLDAMLDRAKQDGYKRFFIETYSSSAFAPARSFYLSQGFACVGEIRSYLPDGDDMLIFAKELTTTHV